MRLGTADMSATPERQKSLTLALKAALSKPLGVGGDLRLTAALTGRHPADIVGAMDGLSRPEILAVFNWLDNDRAAEVLDELDPETVRFLTDNAPQSRLVTLLDHLPMDDAAEIVSEADPHVADSLLADLERLAPADAAEVKQLLSYPEQSAGRLLTDKFACVAPDTTAADVLDYLRRNADTLETVNDVYVLDSDRHLLGVAPLRRVLTALPGQPVREFMTHDPVSVPPETDQQEAAILISRFDLLTLPITSHAGRMLGIVTIDDTIDVLVEGFNEEYLRSVGSDAEELERKTPAQIARLRLPWIMATMLIELLAGVVIHVFNATLIKFILLASFTPIISAISGNTGLQSAAIIIRGLSSGQVQLSGWRHALARQMGTTALLGGACALVLGVIGGVWDRHWAFGLVVFLGMFVSVNIAGIVGTCVPLLSKRAGFDPALTAGPFETAFQDVVGISIFLSLAATLLHWLR
jgi:magnesium transporter